MASRHRKRICYPFATQLLGFCFPFVYGSPQGVVNDCRRIGLHVRQYMAVEIQRDADLAMAEPLAGDFRVNAGRKHMGRMGVAKIVEAEPGQAGRCDLAIPILSKAVRL